jgi:hypothetical protein
MDAVLVGPVLPGAENHSLGVKQSTTSPTGPGVLQQI